MSDPIPDPNFTEKDVTKIVQHYGQPLGSERKQRLMDKLEKERELSVAVQKQKEQKKDRGQEL